MSKKYINVNFMLLRIKVVTDRQTWEMIKIAIMKLCNGPDSGQVLMNFVKYNCII